MAAILFVRIKSGLDAQEFERRLVERRPRFREVPGLVQKIYGRDDATGDVCGIYFFENKEALEAFRETELARTIPAAYEAIDVRREVYDVLYPLWPERRPLTDFDRMADAPRYGPRARDGCARPHLCRVRTLASERRGLACLTSPISARR
jgi:Putative mono-oxygenase ydhR